MDAVADLIDVAILDYLASNGYKNYTCFQLKKIASVVLLLRNDGYKIESDFKVMKLIEY